jgi:hypothetical protein
MQESVIGNVGHGDSYEACVRIDQRSKGARYRDRCRTVAELAEGGREVVPVGRLDTNRSEKVGIEPQIDECFDHLCRMDSQHRLVY